MNHMLTRRSAPASPPMPPPAWVAPLYRRPLQPGQRACCCPAVATYEAVLAPGAHGAADRALLLCGHHARASWVALSAQGAGLYDADGQLVELVHGGLTIATGCRAVGGAQQGTGSRPSTQLGGTIRHR